MSETSERKTDEFREPAESGESVNRLSGETARFEHIAALRDNWDSYGGLAPDARAIECAKRLLVMLRCEPAIVPRSCGGVQLEWHRSGLEIEIAIPASGGTVFYVDEDLGGEDPAPLSSVAAGEPPTVTIGANVKIGDVPTPIEYSGACDTTGLEAEPGFQMSYADAVATEKQFEGILAKTSVAVPREELERAIGLALDVAHGEFIQHELNELRELLASWGTPT